MKRVLIYAAAAIVALASCSKTHVVYKDAPEEIGFKAVTGVMTKDPTNLETDKELGVFAHLYDNDTDGIEYFGNTQFLYDSDSWKAQKYWPVSNSLIFTVYSPYNDTESAVSWNATTKTLSFESVNNSAFGNQTDFLYGTTRPHGSASENSVSVALGHALAKITINVSATASNVVNLEGLSIDQTRHDETCSVNYSSNTPTVSWTTNEVVTSKSEPLISTTTSLTSTPTSKDYLVVPENLDQQTITLKYKLHGSNQELTYTTAVKAGETPNQLGETWAAGKNYIYNISIGPKEIKFSPTVTEWDKNTNNVDGDDSVDISN